MNRIKQPALCDLTSWRNAIHAKRGRIYNLTLSQTALLSAGTIELQDGKNPAWYKLPDAPRITMGLSIF